MLGVKAGVFIFVQHNYKHKSAIIATKSTAVSDLNSVNVQYRITQ